MMKAYVLTGFLAVLAVTSAASEPEQLTVDYMVKLGNPIDNLVTKALEYVRTLFKKYEPFSVPNPPRQTVSGSDVQMTIDFSNLTVSKASDFQVNKIENNLFGLSASFGVTVPKMHIEGHYTAQGTFKGKNVQGDGNFNLDISSLVTSGKIKMEIVHFYLQMKSFDMQYIIQDASFSADGLKVDGMTSDEVKSVFSSSFLNYFQTNEEFVASQVAEYVKTSANDIMKNKGLMDLLNWLKDFINGSVVQ